MYLVFFGTWKKYFEKDHKILCLRQPVSSDFNTTCGLVDIQLEIPRNLLLLQAWAKVSSHIFSEYQRTETVGELLLLLPDLWQVTRCSLKFTPIHVWQMLQNHKIYNKLLRYLRKFSKPSLASKGLDPIPTKSMEFLPIAPTFLSDLLKGVRGANKVISKLN